MVDNDPGLPAPEHDTSDNDREYTSDLHTVEQDPSDTASTPTEDVISINAQFLASLKDISDKVREVGKLLKQDIRIITIISESDRKNMRACVIGRYEADHNTMKSHSGKTLESRECRDDDDIVVTPGMKLYCVSNNNVTHGDKWTYPVSHAQLYKVAAGEPKATFIESLPKILIYKNAPVHRADFGRFSFFQEVKSLASCKGVVSLVQTCPDFSRAGIQACLRGIERRGCGRDGNSPRIIADILLRYGRV